MSTWQNIKDRLAAYFFQYGTWVPELLFGGANVSMTYTSHAGRYCSVGGIFTVFSVAIVLTDKGSSTGAATMTLPFTVGTNSALPMIISANAAITFVAPLVGIVTSSVAYMSIYDNNSGTLRVLTDAAFANNSAIRVMGFFWN